jgi:hypothetical protein
VQGVVARVNFPLLGHVAYHILCAAERGESFDIPPEFTELEEVIVAFLISVEEDKRDFHWIDDALALSMALPPPRGSPQPQPPWTPSRPCRDATDEPWDAWPGATPAWPGTSPPVIGWAPPSPAGPQLPPIDAWSWPQGPFIDLSGNDNKGQA